MGMCTFYKSSFWIGDFEKTYNLYKKYSLNLEQAHIKK